ncbi:hypothetical protein TanjilG_07256 [Lupinus angustifolius]|uniref:Exostosin GT47 domain-containing protein n=2 Tax=Lupinus angustifolius TaxID=3871 RepID=A0A1J7GRD8_LUPAN|nr:PREDICTED: probable glycosyltransferase At5g25310 [Lupinus angustifolius]OIW03104.1 hypothetical protein TanjilG_07256 [Lupinus angustifolius]
MESPTFFFSALFSFLLLSFILFIFHPTPLSEFITLATSNNADYSVHLHPIRTKFSTHNPQLLAVNEDSTAIHRNKSRNRIPMREVGKVEEELAGARASIRSNRSLGTTAHGGGDEGYVPAGAVYRNPRLFYRSYLEMEKILKVYVYPDGDHPIVHDGPCKDIYSIEGRFLHEIEHGHGRFRTNDPNLAHVFFLPLSVAWMVKYLYTPLSYDHSPLRQFVSDYVRVISTKYPFWNRTHGADHFMLACHDWGPSTSKGNPFLYNTSIRVLCNANTSEGFKPEKDVSLPEIHLLGGEVSPKLLSPQKDNNTPRRHLAFFAGGPHGPIRPKLFQYWKNRDDDDNDNDNDIRVYEYLPKDLDYYSFMLNSKFCLCPSGYEVASPRIVESIYAECVPVILSNNYVLPFSDVLQWEAFSLKVDVSDIPRLREILSAIPEDEYLRLKEGVKIVRRHFTLNQPVKRFDVFHMILHSIWLRRLNIPVR